MRIAARSYLPIRPGIVHSLVALSLALLNITLTGAAPALVDAAPLSTALAVAASLPKTTARTGSSPRADSINAPAAATIFLPIVLTSQANSPSTLDSGIAIGVYQPQQDISGAAIDRYTTSVGKKPAFAWQPGTWQRTDGSFVPFPRTVLEEFRTRGIVPGLTWEPSKGPVQSYADRQVAINQTEFSWKELASGRYDAYVSQWAKDAAAYQHPFILRILHEMNGTWYPWGYGVNGNTNLADFVTAYRHIVDLFRAAGATNVQFVWNPTVINVATIQQYGPQLEQAYPGDNYVDWVALDGYNNKPDAWRSLDEIFLPSYQLVTGFSKRPMILFEVGSLENSLDPMARSHWITDGFLSTIPNQAQGIKMVVWFNSVDGQGRDYALDTANALNAWKQVVSSPLYQGSLLK